MADLTTLLVDGVLNMTVRHGVARVTLSRQDHQGAAIPSGLLILPLAQVPAVAEALTRLLQGVEAKVRKSQLAAPVSAQQSSVEAEAPLVESFRFQS